MVTTAGGPYYGYAPAADDGTPLDEADRPETNVQAQHYLLLPPWPQDARLASHPNGLGAVVRPPYGDIGGSATVSTWGPLDRYSRARYLVEGYVTPWDSLVWDRPEQSKRSRLNAGTVVRIQMSVIDCDMAPGYCHGYYTIGGAEFTYKSADSFIDLELLPSPPNTEVHTQSWADTKALFR